MAINEICPYIIIYDGSFLCVWELSKTGSECSTKLEVLQDSAFETNVVPIWSKFSNGVSADRLDFPNPLFRAFFLYPPLSDCVISTQKRRR